MMEGNQSDLNQVQALLQELAVTQKKLKAYADRVISLSNELRTLKENVCQSCKKNFTATLSLASPQASFASRPGSSSRSCPGVPEDSMNFWRLVWQHHALPVLAGCPGSATPCLDINSIFLDQFPSPNPSLNPTLIPISPSITEQSLSTLSISPTGSSSNGIPPPVSQDKIDNGTLHVTFVRSFIRKGQIRSVRFSADGRYLGVVLRKGSGHTTGAIVIFDIETGEETCTLAESSQYSSKKGSNVLCMCFGPNGKDLVVGDTAGRVTVWDIPNKRIRNKFKSHRKSVESVDFSPNGRFIVSASSDKTVRIWDMRDGSARIFSDSAQGLLSVRFSPNGQYIVAGNSGGVLMMWNVRTGHLLDKWYGHQCVVLNVAFTPDGKGLVSGSGDGAVKYWDVSLLGLFQPAGGSATTEILEYKGHVSVVKCVAISPDARWIASASCDKTVILWETYSAVRQRTLVGHEDVVVSVDFSPAGTYLAVGSRDGHSTIWRYFR